MNPARVVIDETRRSFAYLSLYGVATDAVLVNRVLPPEAAAGYFARWAQRERTELEEIEQSFPVPQFRVPLHPTEPIGVEALRELAAETYGDRDPAALFTRARPIRNYAAGIGGIFCHDVKASLQGHSDCLVQGYLTGVGGGDVVPEMVQQVFADLLLRSRPGPPIWKGIDP